jgi:hypothetical protein
MVPGLDNKATTNHKGLAAMMTFALMSAALLLICDTKKSGNVLSSLDANISKPTVSEVPSVAGT